ncbi:MAG: hypothetical protein JXM69_07340 [Anaerolineae bacterium]|nr:hypothetical protein [Anaerolineae bacterium]
MKATHHYKINFVILTALFVSLAVIGLAVAAPPDAQAHPPYGFTPPAPPPPPPPPPPPGGGGDGGNSGGSSGGGQSKQPPPDYVIVQIERCDLSCAVDDALPGVETVAHVQLIHQGSGWITEATLSDAQSTRLAVPYAGRWQVFLVSAPELVAPNMLDTTHLNLAQLQTQLTDGAVLLGEVEINADQTQWIKCPLVCVIEPPPAMPVTGNETPHYPLFGLIGGSLFVLLGLLIFYWGYRFMRPTT